MGQPDSAAYYTDQMIPYLDDLIKSEGKNFSSIFLSNIGYNYMCVGRYEEAEDYLAQSLKIKETAVAFEDLAWIYNKKGDDEYANLLRLKAQEINDNWPKHKILYHLLQYDIKHQNLEGAEQKLYRMMTISDSLHEAQMDRTVLDYQRQFDEQMAQEAHHQQLLKVTILAGALLFVILLLVLYIRYRRAKERLVLTEQQMLISNYVNEIAQLKNQQTDDDTAQQIEELNNTRCSTTKSRRTAPLQAGQTMTTNASSTSTRLSTSPPTTASRRNTSPRLPTTPSSSSSTKWAWTIRPCAASWASPKRPSAPQGTGLCRVERSECCKIQRTVMIFNTFF